MLPWWFLSPRHSALRVSPFCGAICLSASLDRMARHRGEAPNMTSKVCVPQLQPCENRLLVGYFWAVTHREADRHPCWLQPGPALWTLFCCFPIHCIRHESRTSCEQDIFHLSGHLRFLSMGRETSLAPLLNWQTLSGSYRPRLNCFRWKARDTNCLPGTIVTPCP